MKPLVIFLFILILSSCDRLNYKTTIDPAKITYYANTVRPLLKDTYNKDIIFFVDLTKHSGSARFYVIDLNSDAVLDRGLVCNGITDQEGFPIYSNVPGSNASSKGLYKIGRSYHGKFGKAYKLHGLDKTNSNAYRRFVVLHSYKYMPEYETGSRIFESQGCPTVSPGFFKKLDRYIQNSQKPILLYIR